MKKTYILDTSALINDPEIFFRLGEHDIVIPITVMEELDKKKKSPSEAGPGAREAARQIYACQKYGSLKDGARIPTGGTIRISYEGVNWNELPIGLEKTNDNRILLIAKKWQKKDRKVFVVSHDTNLLLKAEACGFGVESCVWKRNPNGLHAGITPIEVPDENLYSEFIKQHTLRLDQISKLDSSKLFENQCCRLNFGNQGCLAILKKSRGLFQFAARPKERTRDAIRALNDEQVLALALLMDPEIGIVALSGKPGSGKTLLALWAGYVQMGREDVEQMIVYRPTHNVDKDMGYLPGDVSAKYEPWCQPIIDNLELIVLSEMLKEKKASGEKERHIIHTTGYNTQMDTLFTSGKILLSPITFVRGRSLHRKFAIGDEAQNWSRNVVKTLLTRKGRGTKMVITGDPEQIDAPYLDYNSNGLSVAIDSLKGERSFGHIILTKSERSDDAQMVANRM